MSILKHILYSLKFYIDSTGLLKDCFKNNPGCCRCQEEKGDYFMYYQNAQMSNIFWRKVYDYLVKISQTQYDFCSSLYIFGDTNPLSHINKAESQWIQSCIMLGRWVIVKNWKFLEDLQSLSGSQS